MKKILLCALAIGALLSASCTKEQRQTTPKVRTISYAMQGNSMYATKSVQSEDVLQAINASLPTAINLSLTSQGTGKVHTATTGQGVVLPSDSYRVLGYSGGNGICSEIVRGTSSYLTHEPAINIDQTLTITDEVTDYVVSGSYESFCLVCDSEMVERAVVKTYNGDEEVNFLSSGTSRIVFAQGNYSSVYLTITLYPKDTERYKETTYTISTARKSGIGFAEFGKFYVLEPTASGFQPKLIGLDLPTFEQETL